MTKAGPALSESLATNHVKRPRFHGGLVSYAAFSRAGTLQRLNQDKVHTTMTGVMSGGRLEGPGTTRYADGTTYEGHHVAGQRSGKGVMHWPNGRVHDGDWANGVPHGKGVFTEKTSKVYEGDFQKGDRTGKGVYRFPGGTRYEGDVLKGQYHGVGSLFRADGRIYMQGTWERNRFVKGWTDLE